MKITRISKHFLGALCLTYFLVICPGATALESTLPASRYPDLVRPNIAEKYKYIENGDLSKALGIPVYEWLPIGTEPKVVILGIHGLTLHGRRFRVLGRALATNGFALITVDMRGFGSCFIDDAKKFSSTKDDKSKVNHEKSYKDIVRLTNLIRKKYDGIKLVAAGECLGCTFSLRLAGEHPELIDGLILSGPSVKVNPSMYVRFGTIPRGLRAFLMPGHEYTLDKIIARHVSNNPDVINEDLSDPYIRKQLPLCSVLSSYAYVNRTKKYGKLINDHFPILIFQSDDDGCVSSKRVIDLIHNAKSDNVSMDWRVTGGHLQLETGFMRSEVLERLIDWLGQFAPDSKVKLDKLRREIFDAGGSPVD